MIMKSVSLDHIHDNEVIYSIYMIMKSVSLDQHIHDNEVSLTRSAYT